MATSRTGYALEVRDAFVQATVATDQPDYAPGSTALITASNFAVGETVEFQVVRTDGVQAYPPGNQPWEVVHGVGSFTPYQNSSGIWVYPDLDGKVDGNISTTWYVDQQYAGASLQLTATGLTSVMWQRRRLRTHQPLQSRACRQQA